MLLHDLRQARTMTQKSVGEALNVNRPAVAKLERRTDMDLSNLRSYIEAMGGRFDIVARFPQCSVVIRNFPKPTPTGWRLSRSRTMQDRSSTV